MARSVPRRLWDRFGFGLGGETGEMSDYTIINADDVDDVYAGSDVPGEFRALSDALNTEQVAVTLIRVPPHCDFEQGTGHYHEEQEELYLVTRGTLTMRFGDDIRHVGAGSVVRVAPQTRRSHRNEGDEPVEMWAVSQRREEADSVKIDDFWEASPDAVQQRPGD
jgi:mannose-6-phosphate isomerase-like protein (cupin superfamily)